MTVSRISWIASPRDDVQRRIGLLAGEPQGADAAHRIAARVVLIHQTSGPRSVEQKGSSSRGDRARPAQRQTAEGEPRARLLVQIEPADQPSIRIKILKP